LSIEMWACRLTSRREEDYNGGEGDTLRKEKTNLYNGGKISQ